jgi:hypothetical protein
MFCYVKTFLDSTRGLMFGGGGYILRIWVYEKNKNLFLNFCRVFVLFFVFESLPQLILQLWIINRIGVSKANSELDITKQELYLSLGASVSNVLYQIYTIRQQAEKRGIGFVEYFFNAMEGK